MDSKNSRRKFIKTGVLAAAASTVSYSFSNNLYNDNIIGHGDFKFKLDKKYTII